MKISKTRLLASTALVSAAMIAGPAIAEEKEMMEPTPPSATLGGFFNHTTHFANQDAHDGSNMGNISSRNNIEVFVNIAGEMANGLKVGGRVEFEGAASGGARVDHTWIDVSSGWGLVRAGYMQSGRYGDTSAVAPPSAAYGVSSGHTHFWFDDTVGGRFEGPLGSVYTDVGDDQPTLTYYSPRFNGFRLTGSYRYRIDNSAATGYGRVANEDTQYHNAMDGSVHYQGEVGGVGVAMMVGAGVAAAPNITDAAACGSDDYQTLNAGMQLSTMGFTVGGQVADVDDDMRCGGGTAMQAGAMYGQGPWAISITAFDGENQHTNAPGDASYTAWSLGFGYTVGPGVRFLASYQDAEMDGEGDADNAGQALMVGVNVGF